MIKEGGDWRRGKRNSEKRGTGAEVGVGKGD